jgi:hypothetical protein
MFSRGPGAFPWQSLAFGAMPACVSLIISCRFACGTVSSPTSNLEFRSLKRLYLILSMHSFGCSPPRYAGVDAESQFYSPLPAGASLGKISKETFIKEAQAAASAADATFAA